MNFRSEPETTVKTKPLKYLVEKFLLCKQQGALDAYHAILVCDKSEDERKELYLRYYNDLNKYEKLKITTNRDCVEK